MSGFPILCVTDRTLCAPRFLAQVEAIAAAHPAGLILREKNLPEADYQALASDVLRICNRYEVPCILHTFVGAAQALDVKYIHLPLPVLRAQSKEALSGFAQIGVSCHSVAERSRPRPWARPISPPGTSSSPPASPVCPAGAWIFYAKSPRR